MKRIAGSALAIMAVLSETESRSISKQTALSLPPNNLATPKFTSWLSAFNTADKDTIISFYPTNFTGFTGYNDTITTYASPGFRSLSKDIYIANWTGGLKLVDLESSPNDASLTVLLQEKNNPRYFRANMVVDKDNPEHLIKDLNLYPVTTPLKMIPKGDPRRKAYEKGR
jgi:hypothetical protein